MEDHQVEKQWRENGKRKEKNLGKMGVLHPLILVGSQAETLSPLQSPLKLKTPESLDYQGVQGFRMRSRAHQAAIQVDGLSGDLQA
jgi:hypothetical protein